MPSTEAEATADAVQAPAIPVDELDRHPLSEPSVESGDPETGAPDDRRTP
jgi:hypothetical protein